MDEAEFDVFYTSSFTRITGQLYAMIGDRVLVSTISPTGQTT